MTPEEIDGSALNRHLTHHVRALNEVVMTNLIPQIVAAHPDRKPEEITATVTDALLCHFTLGDLMDADLCRENITDMAALLEGHTFRRAGLTEHIVPPPDAPPAP